MALCGSMLTSRWSLDRRRVWNIPWYQCVVRDVVREQRQELAHYGVQVEPWVSERGHPVVGVVVGVVVVYGVEFAVVAADVDLHIFHESYYIHVS